MLFNRTHAEHIVLALLMQALFWLAFDSLWLGAAFAIGWFLSREHTQREYKLFVYGNKNPLKPWEGLFGWSADSIGDATWPAIAVVLVAWWWSI